MAGNNLCMCPMHGGGYGDEKFGAFVMCLGMENRTLLGGNIGVSLGK